MDGQDVVRWVGVATAGLGAAALAVAVTTPARSGSFCRNGCVTYPFTDVAAFVPRDYWWMYLAVAFLVVALPHLAGLGATTSRTGPTLAASAVTVLVVDYALQLAVVEPSLLAGETDGLSLLSQYNPHGVFIGLEDVGYALLAVAFLLVGASAPGTDRVGRVVRWTLLGGGALSLSLLVVLAAWYRSDLGSRYEVWGLLVDWLVLVVTAAATSTLRTLENRRPIREAEA